MISAIKDITAEFNAGNGYKFDAGLWETVSWQFVTPSGTISITGTNDAGAVTGSTDGNAVSSTNYTAIQATNVGSGTAVTSVSASGIYKVTTPCRFIQFGGASAAATKVILFMNKPY